jgi:hypothetical protein
MNSKAFEEKFAEIFLIDKMRETAALQKMCNFNTSDPGLIGIRAAQG